MYYSLIKKYYIYGFGFPKRYYTDADLDKFIAKGMITQEQSEEIKASIKEE